jgi:uncharacterized membrane protein (UPF0127 family)
MGKIYENKNFWKTTFNSLTMQIYPTKNLFLSVGKIFLSLGVFIFFLSYTPTLYFYSKNYIEKNFFDFKIIVMGPVSVKAKIADSFEEKINGLSNTKQLKENHGMFFIFEEEDFHGIWMKDMNYSIDIIWFDKFGTIVDVAENVDPKTYPKVFRPQNPSKYVLEVNTGLFRDSNLKIGDSIDLY